MQLAKFTTVIGREVTWVYLQDNWTSIFAATNNLLMFNVTNQFSYSYPSALVIIVLLSAIVPNVMASQGYWTPSDSYPPKGLKNTTYFSIGHFLRLRLEGLNW